MENVESPHSVGNFAEAIAAIKLNKAIPNWMPRTGSESTPRFCNTT